MLAESTLHPFFDIGVNLTNKRFHQDLDDVLQRAVEVGVSGILITGTCELESAAALSLAEEYSEHCWCTAGVHPHDAANVSDDFINSLKHLASQDKVKAIGECGLDFNRNFSPQDKQIEVFSRQLQLAQDLALPVFLHERDAFEQQVEILQQYSDLQGVTHCFTGTIEQMHRYLDLGLYVGVTGWLCDPKRGESLREAVKELPLEKLMIETDAPYLIPKGLPGKTRRNEPCYLPYIASAIAELKGVSIEAVAQASTQNAKSLFRI